MKNFLLSRWLSIKHALCGVDYVLKTQKNSWVYLIFTVLVIIIMFFLHLGPVEVSLLVIVICFVWAAEFINTMIEVLIDFVSPNYNHQAKIIKDVSAATVLIIAFMAALVGLAIILPNLLIHFPIFNN